MTYLKGMNIQKKYLRNWMIFILIVGVWGGPQFILGTDIHKIRVGVAEVPGFTEVKGGYYTGYAYDYLNEIAKYTGWEYEFIEMNLNELIYKLRDGEIDLAAGMVKNEQTEEIYDFPKENAGYTYNTLITLKNNTTISSSNYETLNGIKVGYYNTYKKELEVFEAFCKEREIENIEFVEYVHNEEETLLEALKNKEVDAIINGDVLVQEGQKVVAKFGHAPYYFATTKGNTKILEGLNKALTTIKKEHPKFDQQLYSQYFKNHDDSVNLTKEEAAYVQSMKPLEVIYVDGFAPLQDYNKKTKKAEGVYIDIMKLLAKKSGLRYQLVRAQNYEEAYEMIQNREADLILAATDLYSVATQYDYNLTQSYFDVNMIKVFDVNQSIREDEQIMALPKGYVFTQLDDAYKIRYYDTVEACLQAVKEGEATATYGNSYTISACLTSGYYPNLSTFYEEKPVHVTIGLAKPVDLILLDIINKSVSSLSENEIKEIVYDNTLSIKKPVTFKQFFYDNLYGCTYAIIGSTILLIIVGNHYKHLRKDKLFLLRKAQIDALTGVYNRAAGIEMVTRYFKHKKEGLYSAIAIVDIDYFKQVNDHLGHHIGDELLIEFSRILKSIFMSQDIIFRLGGDEFVIVMTYLKQHRIQKVHERLQQLHKIMDKEVSYQGKSEKVSVSIGAVVTNEVQDFEELYQAADDMLYAVKRSGRNGFKIKQINR